MVETEDEVCVVLPPIWKKVLYVIQNVLPFDTRQNNILIWKGTLVPPQTHKVMFLHRIKLTDEHMGKRTLKSNVYKNVNNSNQRVWDLEAILLKAALLLITYLKNYGGWTARLAQSVEHETLNLRVVGSSPKLGGIFTQPLGV